MLNEPLVGVFLVICLGCFVSINLHNILRTHRREDRVEAHAAVERPSGLIIGLAPLGTLVYFLEVLVYLFLVFTSLISLLRGSLFLLQFPFRSYGQILGLILTSIGYSLFLWSVVVRGRCTVSWEMPQKQTLVTWGPYRYVRTPSYLGYFLMFFGFFFLWPTPFALFPLFAIPGYFRVTLAEERLWEIRFGNEYVEYQKRTGRFVPKVG